jgi:hypothetical protein
LASYYYTTASSNDYFFSATSGWGYAHPERLSDDAIMPYAKLVNYGAGLADTRYIDIWWSSGLRKRNQFYPFLHDTGLRGMSEWSGYQGVEYAPDGMPIVHSDLYYSLEKYSPAVLADMLIKDSAEIKPPWFIVIYGGDPHAFYAIAQHLPKDRFKIVKLDEFFEAARDAQPLMRGRQWKANGSRIVIPGGANETQVGAATIAPLQSTNRNEATVK